MIKQTCSNLVGRTAASFVLLACGSAASAQSTSQPVREFATTSPTTQQTATPTPAELRRNLVNAVDLLFSQFIADPRGLEYRQVKVAVGNVWSGDAIVSTHAWALPEIAGKEPRQVVCWNGMIYSAISVGDKADVRADIAKIIDVDRARRAEWEKKQKQQPPAFQFPYVSYGTITPETTAVSYDSLTTLKTCMLFRTNETALAEEYWAQLSPSLADQNGDPYLMLARDWAWFAFDRAVCAHMRGDDATSLSVAQLLTAAQKQIEATAAAHGFKRPYNGYVDEKIRDPHPPYIEFLGPLPELLADESRRAGAADKPLPLKEAMQIQDKSRRITALIRDLEEISERQWGQPGSVSLDMSPIVKALEREGDDAIEPLLVCVETDRRLTRSVSFHRDFHSGRTLCDVGNAAYLAITHILQTSEFGPISSQKGKHTRKEIVAEIRAFIEKNKGKSAAERWFTVLDDDHAQPRQWTEAAHLIVQPRDIEERSGWVITPNRAGGKLPAMRGEELRAKKDPSVTELVTKRIPQVAIGGGGVFAIHEASRMAMDLVKWDRPNAAPALRTQIDRCKLQTTAGKTYGGNSHLLPWDVSELTAILAEDGDRSALKSYADWIHGIDPSYVEYDPKLLFRAMWENSENPDIAATAEWMFNDPASAWHSLPHINDPFGHGGALVMSPLLAIPGFQKAVLTGLADQTRIGVATIQDGRPLLTMEPGVSMACGLTDATDPLLPKPGEKRIVRVCDWFAVNLSRLDGSPQFEGFWPQSDRDATMADCKLFVAAWSTRFRFSKFQSSLSALPSDPLHMTFPQRDRPATPEEVVAHSAIFSLSGAGEIRAVPLDRFPIRAKWTTQKRWIVHFQTFDEKTNQQKIISEFDQLGLVWQAEEVLEAGKWKRYYGFVGNRVIAKVPAEEIQLFKNADPSERYPQ